MRQHNIHRIYLATLVLGIAYGISIALTALVLNEHGFGKQQIGALAAVFASGIVLASLPVGAIVRRFSARTTLAVATVGYALAVTTFPWPHSMIGVGAIRFVDGACSVGIWVSAETVLLAQAEKEKKAQVTSVYAIAMSIGYVVGPAIAYLVTALLDLPMWVAFAVSGAIALFALIPIFSLDRDAQLAPLDNHLSAAEDVDANGQAGDRTGIPSPWLHVLWKIKTACFATFAYGYFQAAVVLFLPLYLMQERGIAEKKTIYVTAFFAAGMLLFTNVAGRIGDKLGHLAVMRVLAVIGLLQILGFVFLPTYGWMLAAVFIAGATLASLSPLSIALQGNAIEPRDYSRGNSMYNALYAAGMLLGPAISSLIFAAYKGAPMLYHLAGLWACFVVFSLVFAKDDPRSRAAKGHSAPKDVTTSSASSPA